VVEDEELVRITIERLLVMEGHEVVTAANGREALEALGGGPFDLVITDLVMPEKQGIETIIELKAQSPGSRIIAISGEGKSNVSIYLDLARKLGAAATLTKPFGRTELLRTIGEVLHSRDSETEER